MNVSAKKEWLGESGYCNCLLVAMSRMRIPNIELVSDQSPPNLETLTTGRPTTYAWIRAQEFDYAGLDTSEIIRIRAEQVELKSHCGAIGLERSLHTIASRTMAQ